MITYDMHFQPIIECIGYLEHYVNQDVEYTNTTRFRLSEEEKVFLDYVRQICKEVGSKYRTQFQDTDILFTYMSEEKGTSLMRALLYDHCDFCGDPYDQIKQIETYYREDPTRLIQEIIAAEKGEYISSMHPSSLLFDFDELLLKDTMKWQLWKMQFQVSTIFAKMREIIKMFLPIYQQHHAFYEKEILTFKEEIKQADNALYEKIMQSLKFESKYTTIRVIPSLSICPQLSISDNDEEQSTLMFYSIKTYEHLLIHSEIEDEQLCSAMKLLSDKSKFDILRYISDKRAYGAQIANELHLTTATISYHMQALLNVQLICIEKENNRQYYSLNKNVLKEYLHQIESRLLNEKEQCD